MNLVNAVAVARMLTRDFGGPPPQHPHHFAGALRSGDISFGSMWWYVYAGVSCVLVLFAGIMSGLTLGLMSLGLVDVEILQRSGSPTEKKQAGELPGNSLLHTWKLIPNSSHAEFVGFDDFGSYLSISLLLS